MPGRSPFAARRQAPLDGGFWRAALFAVAITGCGSLPVFLVGGLAVQIRAELDLPVSRVGLLTAVFFTTSSLFSSMAGRITEGIGPGSSMRIAGLVSALALLGLAAAPSTAVLIAFLVLAGLPSALGQVGSNLSLARRVDDTRQAFAFGIKQSGIPAATLLGGLAVPLVALTIGWRWAFVIGALLSATVALALPTAGLRNLRMRWSHTPAADASLLALVVLSCAGALGAAAANSMGSYLVDSSVTAGVAEGPAGLLYAAGSIAGLSTRVGAGWLADRASGGRLLWVAGQLLAGTIGFGMLATGSTVLLLPATLLAFAGGWGWPGLFNFAIVTRNRSAPAAATGITQTGVYLGGVVGPLLFGGIAEHSGYDAAWTFAAALGLTGALAVVVGRRLLNLSTQPRRD